jgi:hypothetical protein
MFLCKEFKKCSEQQKTSRCTVRMKEGRIFFYTGSQLTHGQRRVKQVYGNVQQDR